MCSKNIFLLLLLISTKLFSQEKLEVFFDFNEHALNQEATSKLNSWIAKNNNIEVVNIFGYCDWVGSNVYNDSLSMRRAKEVFNFLKSNNISISESYQLKGFGEDFKQAKNQSQNRKVLIAYRQKGKTVESVISLSDQVKTSKPGDKIKLKNINFFNNSAVIVPKSIPVLEQLLRIMKEHPNLKIEIQGHICCQRFKDVSDISTARARAIYTYLVTNKIDRERLQFKGYGISNPIYPIPEQSEFEENENRRVEILILEN